MPPGPETPDSEMVTRISYLLREEVEKEKAVRENTGLPEVPLSQER